MKNFVKIIIITVITAVTIPALQAQELKQVTGVPQNETKAERKAREKQLEQLRDSIAFVEATNALNEQYFVITADRIMLDNRVNIASPDPRTNFILVQGKEATVQLAFNNGRLGLNGLGGITVDGTITNYKQKTTKKGDINCEFGVNGINISAQVRITIYKNSNRVIAYVSPNFNSNDMTVYGTLVPYDHQKILKGDSK